MTLPDPPGPTNPQATDSLSLCPACSNDRTHFFLWGKSRYNDYWYRYDTCPECGLVFLNPRIPATHLTQALEGREHTYLKYLPTQRFDTAEADLNLVRPALRLHPASRHEPLRWLDLGCGIGNLLTAARKRGCHCWGLDVDRSLIGWAKENHAEIRFSETSLENQPFDMEFDMISADNVLEHISHPKDFLLSAREILSDEGLLVVRVPNFNSILRYLSTLSGQLPTSFIIDPDAHPFNYSRNSLIRLLASSGFEPVKTVEHLMISYTLRRVLNHLHPKISGPLQGGLIRAAPLMALLDRLIPKGGLDLTVFAKKATTGPVSSAKREKSTL